jgi:hypothetical protein
MDIERAKLEAIRKMSDSKSKEIYVPISIFSNDKSLLGALTEYLKEELGLKNAEIARLLNKDYRSTWLAYKKIKK